MAEVGELDVDDDVAATDIRAANWYPPPSAGVKSPTLWGTAARITEMFGLRTSPISIEQRAVAFRWHSAQHWLDLFKRYKGPLLKPFAALEPRARSALSEDLFVSIEQFDRSGDDAMVVPSNDLEIVLGRR